MNVVNGVARSLKYQQNVILSVKGSHVKLSILLIVIYPDTRDGNGGHGHFVARRVEDVIDDAPVAL